MVFICSFYIAAIMMFAGATYSDRESVVIHPDGSVTPSNAPLVRSGETYTLTDDINIPSSTNEGIIIERDNVILDGAGYRVLGNGESSAILLEDLLGVTITGFTLENFYWGLEIRGCINCVIYGNNLTAVNYPIHITYSDDNLFYHNNVLGPLYYADSDNQWDNGYPVGGNYWMGYPYADSKRGPDQNLPGSDGIGDVQVGEEIFSSGGDNVDRYPLMSRIKYTDVGKVPQDSGSDDTPQASEPNPSSLKVIVRNDNGGLVPGADVVSTEQPNGQVALSSTTDSDGVVIFMDIVPGDYTLQISKSGYTVLSSGGYVVEGETTIAEFVLEAQAAEESGETSGGIPGFQLEIIFIGVILVAVIHSKQTLEPKY
jgi:hypothetical protein